MNTGTQPGPLVVGQNSEQWYPNPTHMQGQGWSWVGYESGVPIPYPKSLPMDTRISIPISIHTQILPRFIIHGYPYPTQNPFNFFFLNPKHFNLKTNQQIYLLKKKKKSITMKSNVSASFFFSFLRQRQKFYQIKNKIK